MATMSHLVAPMTRCCRSCLTTSARVPLWLIRPEAFLRALCVWTEIFDSDTITYKGETLFTQIDFDESLGLTLAQCYRLARERARSHDSNEQSKIVSADMMIEQEVESSDGCTTAQPVIQSS